MRPQSPLTIRPSTRITARPVSRRARRSPLLAVMAWPPALTCCYPACMPLCPAPTGLYKFRKMPIRLARKATLDALDGFIFVKGTLTECADRRQRVADKPLRTPIERSLEKIFAGHHYLGHELFPQSRPRSQRGHPPAADHRRTADDWRNKFCLVSAAPIVLVRERATWPGD